MKALWETTPFKFLPKTKDKLFINEDTYMKVHPNAATTIKNIVTIEDE